MSIRRLKDDFRFAFRALYIATVVGGLVWGWATNKRIENVEKDLRDNRRVAEFCKNLGP